VACRSDPSRTPALAITVASDPRLDDFRALSDADVRPDRRGVVIAEGVQVVERLLASPYPVRAIVGVPAKLDALSAVLADPRVGERNIPTYAVDKWLLSDVVGFRVTRGVLASADRGASPAWASVLASARRLAVLEGLNDFENLGALFRNAAAFGIDAVLLAAHTADPLYRRSVRVSMGHVLNVPFVTVPGDWPAGLDAVAAAGFGLVALSPAGEVRLAEVDPPPRWALLLGAEGPGLSAPALARSDLRVRIPMASGVDSLNVATAAAVAFAHFVGRGDGG
jgi:tRNA G18 (ribose-2'-O)-methylase SpoU